MSNYNELVGILKELLFNRFYPKPEFIHALLGDGRGNVIVPNRPDYNYVRFNRSATETFEVFNKEVSQPVDGTPVLVGSLPWQPNLTQVVGIDWATYLQTGWGDSYASLQAHHETHEWPNFAPGSDVMNVYMRSITPMRTQAAGSGSTSVIVTAYEYDGATGTNYNWPGLPPANLQPATPPTGSMRYMGVYLNPMTNTLGVVTGSTTIYTDAAEPAHPAWPRLVMPSAYVRLYGGQAAITERDIRDARRLWEHTLIYTGSLGPHNLLSAFHPDTLPGTVTAGDLIYGNSTPKWTRLPIVTGSFLGSGAGTPAWSALPFATQAEVETGLVSTRIVSPSTAYIRIKNTSGATANANDVGYIDEAGEYKTTTTASDTKSWAVVVSGGANNADITVTTRGRRTVKYTGTAPSAGHYLTTSTVAGSALRSTVMDPAIFAVCLAAGSGGLVEALLLCNTRFEAMTNANDIARPVSCGTSNFTGTINGTPSGSTLVYTITGGTNEESIKPFSSSQITKLVLHNTTRGDYGLISSVDITTNTITLTAAVPGAWANTDVITCRSQVNTLGVGASFFYDHEFAAGNIPILTRAIQLAIGMSDSGGAGQLVTVHPYETGAAAKATAQTTQSTQFINMQPIVNVINSRIDLAWTASGSATALVICRLRGVYVAAP